MRFTVMQVPMQLPSASLQQLVEQIFTTRRITRADQRHFMAVALSADSLDHDEQALVDRVFEALKKGLLRVVE